MGCLPLEWAPQWQSPGTGRHPGNRPSLPQSRWQRKGLGCWDALASTGMGTTVVVPRHRPLFQFFNLLYFKFYYQNSSFNMVIFSSYKIMINFSLLFDMSNLFCIWQEYSVVSSFSMYYNLEKNSCAKLQADSYGLDKTVWQDKTPSNHPNFPFTLCEPYYPELISFFSTTLIFIDIYQLRLDITLSHLYTD